MRRLSFDARDRLQQSAMQTASAMHELAKKAKKKVAKKHRAMAGGPTADDLLDDDDGGGGAGGKGALHILKGGTIFSDLRFGTRHPEDEEEDSDEDKPDSADDGSDDAPPARVSLKIDGEREVDEVHEVALSPHQLVKDDDKRK